MGVHFRATNSEKGVKIRGGRREWVVGIRAGERERGGGGGGEVSGVTYPGPQGIIGVPRSKIVLYYG